MLNLVKIMVLEFIGSGTMTIAMEDWRSCFALALAFAWQPAGTLAPVQIELPGYVTDWDGNYFDCRMQCVNDSDAKLLSGALMTAISTRNSDKELSYRQFIAFLAVPKESESYVLELAHFAEKAGFLIAPGWPEHSL